MPQIGPCLSSHSAEKTGNCWLFFAYLFPQKGDQRASP